MNLYGKRTRDVANRIVEAFKEPEKLPKALTPMFIHRKDDVPCRRWSWHNQLLVALSGTADARGFRQWNDAGRTIKKGSKAIWILAPCLKTVRVETDDLEETTQQILIGFRSVPVFALEDTEGEPVPSHDDRYAPWLRSLPLIEVAEAWGIQVDAYTHTGKAPLGYYQYAAGNQAVMLGVENLSTWAHELIHAADHRLTDLQGQQWQKEIVAELGGAVLLECMGHSHDADLGGAFAYIQRHAAAANTPIVKACIQFLDRTCNCVQLILDEAQRLSPEPPGA